MKPESCRLSAYIDGELGPSERRRVEEHLAGCPKCVGNLEALRQCGDLLSRAGGGLLLHVDLARLVIERLPEKRRSLVMDRTQGVRRRLALIGFGVAMAFALFSFFRTGPGSVMRVLPQPQQLVFFLNWAIMIAAGSMLVWPEKIASLEARFWAFARDGSPRVSARERLLVQGMGLVFLVASSAVHYLLMRNLGL